MKAERELIMFDSVIIGKRISEARNEKKMTQRELAEKTNIALQQIKRYEAGQDLTRLELLDALVNALGKSPNYYMGHDAAIDAKLDELISELNKLNELIPDTLKLLTAYLDARF